MLYTGRTIGGDDAYRLGLCDRLVPAEELRPVATELATEIAGSAPLAVRSIRDTMRGPVTELVRTAMQRERAEQERLLRTADFREGVKAMRERRTPQFEGR
jgi:enoyl-CoA hydratase/carnithine racemase